MRDALKGRKQLVKKYSVPRNTVLHSWFLFQPALKLATPLLNLKVFLQGSLL